MADAASSSEQAQSHYKYTSCVVCQHCQDRLSGMEDIAVREGYSYHKSCHKCYVCSETNLKNAEVFQGVIFCSSCSQRIFQCCSTARKSKNGKSKASKARVKRRERSEYQAKKRSRGKPNVNGVLELTRVTASTESAGSDTDSKQQRLSSNSPTLSKNLPHQKEKTNSNEDTKDFKNNSTEMGMTTDVTLELLRQMNCPVVDDCKYESKPPPTDKGDSQYNKNIICSDLRIAELGASTEIAHMALRKKSEVPVIMKSDVRETVSLNLSGLHQESDVSGDKEWLDSGYYVKHYKQNWLDKTLGSVLKMPYKFFKRNILHRSPCVNDLVSRDDDSCALVNRLKNLFYEEITDHQCRGLKRLYSTINRQREPYKLGWLNLMANVSVAMSKQIIINHGYESRKRCKHFKRSHSYRCMRAQAMRLAGPTKSELACYRSKIKKILSPSYIKRYVIDRKVPAILTSQACGNDGVATQS